MKKLALISALSLMAITQVNAADGTLIIDGEVVGQSCKIINPTGDTLTVTMNKVGVASLKAAGDTAIRTAFQIVLQDCPAGKVATYFEPDENMADGTDGRLKNIATTGAAKNVDVQLLGNNFKAINLLQLTNGAQTNSQWVDVNSTGGATLSYWTQYYATGVAEAGKVHSKIKYTIVYQ